MELDPRLCRITASQPYPLVFATLSGAHLYGFASADSDWDLRGAHVLPIEQVAGLKDRDDTIEDSPEANDGFELDLVTHDIEKFMRLMLKRNGYVLEQLYSPLVVATTPEHQELKALGKDCLTRHHAHHEKLPSGDLDFHRGEYERLVRFLESERDRSGLPDRPSARSALHDLLLRLRLEGPSR